MTNVNDSEDPNGSDRAGWLDTQQIAQLAINPNVANQTAKMPHPYGTADAMEWINAAKDKREDRSACVIVLKPAADRSGGTEVRESLGRRQCSRDL
uniref:hypothetical protein n=1 Tax=Pararhizobium sp. IMCC3301 TaxID=3067904 RepID=UPI002741CCD4|nr:hypothetical protein [Pararhizobium sp. IMCC3301]